jgi:hypothetical protein
MEKTSVNKILAKLDKIEKKLSKEQKNLSDYISEDDAKVLLKRETTWFWNLRQKGFPHTKMGGKNYYLKQNFIKLLESNEAGSNDLF